MKVLIALLTCLVFVSCATSPKPFVQGDIRIVPPVQQESSEDGQRFSTHYNDGGTVKIQITDVTGTQFDVFFDHRILTTETGDIKFEPGTIYLNAYPERSGSVLVLDQKRFRDSILNGINY